MNIRYEEAFREFEDEPNYYYESWINGNKSHVVESCKRFKGTRAYDAIILQFSQDTDALEQLLSRV